MNSFPTESVRKNLINDFCENYSFLTCRKIGESACKRDIDALCIGSCERMVLWCGAFHAMEWLTSLLLFKFVHDLCESIKNGVKINGTDAEKCLKNRGLMIVPCVNPDGTEIFLNGIDCAGKYKSVIKDVFKPDFWQSNARGVDLNHNYNAGFSELRELEKSEGINFPSATRYGGSFPESEPETRALTKLCRENNFSHAIAFHSQGEEIYWKYGDNIPKDSEFFAKLLAFSSGCALSSPEGLAVGGGFKDWFIKEFNRPAFTVEVGMGKNPLPLADLQPIYLKIHKMLLISALVI